ncbi:MAG: hypothetical protein AAB449_02765 [Patescibacteria group bacterium]
MNLHDWSNVALIGLIALGLYLAKGKTPRTKVLVFSMVALAGGLITYLIP